jgi:hypothetical protein
MAGCTGAGRPLLLLLLLPLMRLVATAGVVVGSAAGMQLHV